MNTSKSNLPPSFGSLWFDASDLETQNAPDSTTVRNIDRYMRMKFNAIIQLIIKYIILIFRINADLFETKGRTRIKQPAN
jgi:hypothetical protein